MSTLCAFLNLSNILTLCSYGLGGFWFLPGPVALGFFLTKEDSLGYVEVGMGLGQGLLVRAKLGIYIY